MTIDLGPDVEAQILKAVETGRYRNADDVVGEALLLLEARDAERLRADVVREFEQLDRGESLPFGSGAMERVLHEATENARRGKPIKDGVRP